MLKVIGKRIIVVLLIIFILAGGAAGYFWHIQSQYKDYQVKRGTLKTFIASSGKIRAEKEAELKYNSAGWISDLPVKENEEVKEGQIVAQIDPTEARKNVQEAENSYRSAKSALDKVIDDIHLFQYGNGGYDKVGTASETQAQKTLRQQAEEVANTAYDDLAKARYSLSRSVLKAPFDGVVTSVTAQLNESTSAFSSVPIIQIADLSTIYFEAEVDQEKSGLVKQGQTAQITLDALKEQPLTGYVSEVSYATKTTPEGDIVLPIKIKIDSPGGLKLGWKGDIQIDLETKENVLLIPKHAIEYENGQSVIRYKDGFFFKTRQVSLGGFDGTNWEVTEGATEDEILQIKR